MLPQATPEATEVFKPEIGLEVMGSSPAADDVGGLGDVDVDCWQKS